MVDGVPKVMWSPDLGAERVYKVLGSTDLQRIGHQCRDFADILTEDGEPPA